MIRWWHDLLWALITMPPNITDEVAFASHGLPVALDDEDDDDHVAKGELTDRLARKEWAHEAA
jgi:hypothetical protein